MDKKLIIALPVVLILAGIGGVWYYAARTQMPPSAAIQPTTSPQAPAIPVTAASSTISYVNDQYGFSVTLPADWQGYTIVTTMWTGNTASAAPAEHGPIFSIRNPRWASSTPTQDIPVMVFTSSEWAAVSSGAMPVSAAPIPPSELGQNARYVFALPARYNYAFPEGWQEVQSIIQSDPLHAF